MGRRTKARECAVQMLYQWEIGRASIGDVMTDYWSVRSTVDATRALAERMVRGVCQHQEAIDLVVTEACTNWRFDRLATIDKCVLRLGSYELMMEPGTPVAVVIDEAIELARRFGEADSPAFVNGVLDAVRRKVRGEKKGQPHAQPASKGAGSKNERE